MPTYTYDAPSNGYKFRITLTQNKGTAVQNWSTVDWQIEHYRAGTSYTGVMDRELTINGTKVYDFNNTYDVTSRPAYSWWTVATGTTGTIAHNTDGSKTIPIVFLWDGTSGGFGPGTVSESESWVMSVIERYSYVDSFTVNQIRSNKVTVNLTVTDECDQYEYSTNGGGAWSSPVSGDFTSTSFDITGLTANTSYDIQVRFRRKDTGLTTTSSSENITTLPSANFMAFFKS